MKTFDYLGPFRYSLTFCTKRRRGLFVEQPVVDLVLQQISRSAAEQGFEIIAYCFMPDHLHLVIEGKAADSDCKQFINKMKQYSGFYYKHAYGSALWQRYGYEHVLRDEEATATVARYILDNPVRAGLVQRVEDYAFVGSLVYTLEELLAGLAAWSG